MKKPRAWPMALAWLAIVAAAALASPYWRELDWWLLAQQTRNDAAVLHPDLMLVDLPYDPQVPVFRRRLLGLLQELERVAQDGGAPRAIVLDIEFVNDETDIEPLVEALNRLRKLGTRVYAVVVPLHDLQPDPHYLRRHAKQLYERAIDNQGHPAFNTASGLAMYRPWIDLGDGQRVPALAVQVAEDLFNRPQDADERPILLRLGAASALPARTVSYHLATGRLQFPAGMSSLKGRIAIVGSLADDRPTAIDRAGPEVLAWAVSARGQPPETSEARVLASPALLVLLVLVCGTLAAGVARWVYAALPRSHSHPQWIGWAAAAAPLSLLVAGSTALAATGALVLPQLSVPALAALVAAALLWVGVRRHLQWHSLQPDAAPLAAEYDVFVSYSRTDPAHQQWVEQHIVAPLAQLLRPDGKPCRVFFDKKAIRLGDTWIQTMYHAVDASRYFLPVYSVDYFEKEFCKLEITHALRRHRVGRIYFLPVDVAGMPIPSPYDSIQAIRVADHPQDYLALLIDAMQRGWQADQAAKAASTAVKAS